MPQRIIMSGYYGFRNAGDDAICGAVIDALQQEIPQADITVLSNDPALTEATYGVHAINRWMPTEFLPMLKKADLFISGGGSLLQDVTSRFGISYYLGLLTAAQRLGVPTLVYAQGLGPLQREASRRATAHVLNRVDVLSVRDDASRALLREIGVQKPVFIAPDPVLAAPATRIPGDAGRNALLRAGCRLDKPLLIVALRPWQTDHTHLYARVFDQLVQEGNEVAFLPMHTLYDNSICTAVAGHMNERAVVLNGAYDIETLFSIFGQAACLIGMRLHTLIMGAASGKKLVALSYDPKVDAFMQQIQVPFVLPVDEMDEDNLLRMIHLALETAPLRADRLAALARGARLPAKLAAKMLGV